MKQTDRVLSTPPTNSPTSRRRFLSVSAGIPAAVAAVSIPSTALAGPTSGLVQAAIEAHKAAWSAYGVEVNVTDRLETALPKDMRQSSGNAWDGLKIVETDDPSWIAHVQTLEALSNAFDDASIALLNLEPATAADLLALVSYIVDLEARGVEFWPDVEDERMQRSTWDKCFHRLIADALGKIGAAA